MKVCLISTLIYTIFSPLSVARLLVCFLFQDFRPSVYLYFWAHSFTCTMLPRKVSLLLFSSFFFTWFQMQLMLDSVKSLQDKVCKCVGLLLLQCYLANVILSNILPCSMFHVTPFDVLKTLYWKPWERKIMPQ